MRSTFFSIVAMLLLLTGYAFGTCYTGGPKFSDVGTDDEVNKALDELCKKLDGDCPLNKEVSACQNVNGHGLHANILPVQCGSCQLGVTIIQEACLDLLNQVKSGCQRGGALGLLKTHSEDYGGDAFVANVVLDPNQGGC